MSKILVTGGAGAVGSNLIEALIKRGDKVISWDNYSVGKESNHIDGADYFNIDTALAAEELLEGFDTVYHLGEYSKVVPSFNEIKTVFEYNIKGSFRLIELCSELKIPIIYAGSSTKLSYPGEMHSPYSFFKSTIAKLVQGYGDWYGLNYNICYFYNAYGPKTDTWGNEWQTVINVFNNQKKAGKPLTVTGDGTQRRDFTHVDDIVQGLLLAGNNIINAEFQLGTGVDHSILEIAEAFDHPIEFIASRPGDRPRGLADISYTKSMLGYNPTSDVIEYIKSL